MTGVQTCALPIWDKKQGIDGLEGQAKLIKEENSLPLEVNSVEQLGSDSYLYGVTIGDQELSIKLNNQTDIRAQQKINVGFDLDNAHWFDSAGKSL